MNIAGAKIKQAEILCHIVHGIFSLFHQSVLQHTEVLFVCLSASGIHLNNIN
jgi:hypothetical protein